MKPPVLMPHKGRIGLIQEKRQNTTYSKDCSIFPLGEAMLMLPFLLIE